MNASRLILSQLSEEQSLQKRREDLAELELRLDERESALANLQSDLLYREVARKFHPDLSSCPQERQSRHQLMVEINRAYETGAEDRLQEPLEAGEGMESVEMSGAMSAEMILLVRNIAESKQRLAQIESEIEEITVSEIYRLKLRVENSAAMGIDLFADLVAQVDRQIKKARNRLESLQGVMLTG